MQTKTSPTSKFDKVTAAFQAYILCRDALKAARDAGKDLEGYNRALAANNVAWEAYQAAFIAYIPEM